MLFLHELKQVLVLVKYSSFLQLHQWKRFSQADTTYMFHHFPN